MGFRLKVIPTLNAIFIFLACVCQSLTEIFEAVFLVEIELVEPNGVENGRVVATDQPGRAEKDVRPGPSLRILVEPVNLKFIVDHPPIESYQRTLES